MSKAVKKYVIELQEFECSFLVEDNTKTTLADLLTYKENPLLVREDIVKKVAKIISKINNAHVFFFDGS